MAKKSSTATVAGPIDEINQVQLDTLLGMSRQVFEGIETLTELNLQATRTALDQLAEQMRQTTSVKDLEALTAMQTRLIQLAQENALAYGQKLAALAAAPQGEISQQMGAHLVQAMAPWQNLIKGMTPGVPS
jgi:phasin family protein